MMESYPLRFWVSLACGAGMVFSVVFLPWVDATGSLVGHKTLTFWDIRPGLNDIAGSWLPVAFVALIALCSCALSVKPDKHSWGTVIPLVWCGYVVVTLNNAISTLNHLGTVANIHVGIGAWVALACSVGIAGATVVGAAVNSPEQASTADERVS